MNLVRFEREGGKRIPLFKLYMKKNYPHVQLIYHARKTINFISKNYSKFISTYHIHSINVMNFVF